MDKLLYEIRVKFENGAGATVIEWLRENVTEAEIEDLHGRLYPPPTDEEKEIALEQIAVALERVGKPGIAETVRREKPVRPGQGGGRK